MNYQNIGIMGAMPEEIAAIFPLMQNVGIQTYGGRQFHTGYIGNQKVVLVFSRWGKVAAAATVTALIHQFNIDALIFTGVAGAAHHSVKIGDIVIGKAFVQHDLDARPLMPKHEIPLLGLSYIQAEDEINNHLKAAVEIFLKEKNNSISHTAEKASWHIGNIASGDIFVHTLEQKNNAIQGLDNVFCIEMEGAAVAQVCYEYSVPFAVMRIISDNADGGSPQDFDDFIQQNIHVYSSGIIKTLFKI